MNKTLLTRAALLIAPVSFEASAGIIIENNPSLLSELRAFGGMLTICGAVVVLGAFFTRLYHLSLLTSTILLATNALAERIKLQR